MKWLRTFSIVEIFLKGEQGTLESVLDIKFLLKPNLWQQKSS